MEDKWDAFRSQMQNFLAIFRWSVVVIDESWLIKQFFSRKKPYKTKTIQKRHLFPENHPRPFAQHVEQQ